MTDQAPTPVTRRWPFLALTAAGFAVLMTVGPIIATSGVDAGGSDQAYTGYNVGMMAARTAVSGFSTPVVPAATDPVDVPAAIPAVATTPSPTEPAGIGNDTPVTTPPVDATWDESLVIELELEGNAPTDGETATWKITVTNDGDEYLWGVYAYLEGFGRTDCDARQLAISASTTCWAEQKVWSGPQEAVAWTTAWTADHMLENQATATYEVAP